MASEMPFEIMGILNVTPDSFSDGGLYLDTNAAIDHALKMAHDGADVIDVGGESSRPYAVPVPLDVELDRVIPVIKRLKKEGVIRISIDTVKPQVAQRAVDCGATLINDISAKLCEVAAKNKVGWVAMHMLGDPTVMQTDPKYDDVVAEVKDFLISAADKATKLGVEEIWIDPGFGFGKRVKDNVKLLNAISEFQQSGLWVLVGLSRKSFLGRIGKLESSLLDDNLISVDKRKSASVAAAMYSVLQGAKMVRVHDVLETYQAFRLLYELSRVN